ncbi:uncharacterized protein LOC143471066 [Clavelina lepadiformis]|uniref:uncharacterized protein LOC143471066 n=1 Tax=Clavelina lepadiformis TaxID=159417 RepID=UPI004041DCD2
MIDSMGNCFPWSKGKLRGNISLMIVGLDNAGKTTAANRVRGASIQHVAPTVGFSPETFKFGKFNVTLIDLGGGRRIRDIWKNYLAEIHAVIYVVDSSDVERAEESKNELTQLLSNPLVKEKPVLLLANKQDKDGAMGEADVCDLLNLEEIVNDNRCLCKVELITATAQSKKDRTLQNAMTWLVNQVAGMYEDLNARVERDIEERDIQIEEDRIARAERVRIRREERARKEEEEAAQNQVGSSNENIHVVAQVNGTDDATNALNERHVVDNQHRQDLTTSNQNGMLPILPEEESQTGRSLSTNGNSARSVKSGLGDELLDEEEPSLPGSAQSKRTCPGEDSGTESYRRVQSRLSDIVRDTPSICATPSGEADINASDKDETASIQGKKKGKRSNRVSPMPDHPHAIVLAPLKPKGKLSPLASTESGSIQSQSSQDLGVVRKLDYNPLPPLKLSKPNVESDDDILV